MKRITCFTRPMAGFFWLLGVLVAGPAGAIEIDGQTVPLNHVTAEACKDCHEEIYKQWRGSMHANSTAFNDPIHNAFYRRVVGDPTAEGVLKKGKLPVCLQCHVPNAAVDQTSKTDALPAYVEGVNCVACHALTSYEGIRTPDGKLRLGLLSYGRGDTLGGPMGFIEEEAEDAIAGLDETENPHLAPTKGAYMPLDGRPRLFRTSDACLGCHDQRNNFHGVPLCQTGNEYTMGESRVPCQTCHMSVTNGVADHSMGGGHSMAMLRRSMVLDVTVETRGDTVTASVFMENLQPHSMPTGAPFRNIFVKVTALDADGEPLWTNFETHPATEDPKAYMHLVLLDENGQPTLPPKAHSAGDDSRLKPYEQRTLTYDIPAAGVAAVRAELFYNLLWPSLQQAMAGKIPDELVTPQRFMFAEARL